MITRARTVAALAASITLAALSPATMGQSLTVVAEGLKKPTGIVTDPTHSSRFYIVEQKTCAIRIVESGALLDEPLMVLDTKEQVQTGNWEQGLLGIELDPDFANNKHFYVNYTAHRLEKRRDPGSTHIARFTMTDAHTADPATEKIILTVEQPWGNHNCGNLRFGPDGMLYIGMGDGGAANDPRGAGLRLDTLLGKILRIDVHGTPDEGLAYAVPADNPFVDNDEARPEIWAYGVRNPWGFEFDAKGRLWWADVGQNRYEEINMQPADSEGGENYGWNTMEGFRAFKPRGGPQGGPDPKKQSPEEHAAQGFTAPIWDYRHFSAVKDDFRNGSVTGGHFYGDTEVSALRNRYIFADFMFGKVWTFKVKNGRADDVVEMTAVFADAFPGGDLNFSVSAFGKDTDGEPYVLDHKGGRLLKIVSESAS